MITARQPLADLDVLWRETLGDPRVTVAILDGAPNLALPCFAGARIECLETLAGCGVATGPSCDHATAIASILFAQPGRTGLHGVAPGCRGLVLPIFRDAADGTVAPCSQIDLARAIDQGLAAGAQIINISAGQLTLSGKAHPLLADAIRNCARRGVLVVSAVGNDGCECLHIPGALETVLAVGAIDASGQALEFSNWGGPYAAQGIMAPGNEIPSAACDGTIVSRSGTSFATAIVSGVAALLVSLQVRRDGRMDPLMVRTALFNSVLPCDESTTARSHCERLLAGRLHVRGAVSLLQPGVKPMTNYAEPASTSDIAESHALELSPSSASAPPSTEGRQDIGPTVDFAPALVLPSSADPGLSPQDSAEFNVPAVQPSACGCGCSKTSAPQLVYALGRLGYDYVSLARRDSITQHMDAPPQGGEPNPDDPAQLLKYLETHPWDAQAIIWTLNIEDTPVYAIRPSGPYAQATYDRLRDFLHEQVAEGVQRISVPGYIAGKVRLLMAHMDVPLVVPELRDMCSWNTPALVTSVLGKEPTAKADKEAYEKKGAGVRDFLDRVYHGFRNLGILPQDRAVNYAATHAFQISAVFEAAIKSGRELDNFDVVPSPMCRPDSECWDVKLVFFDPAKQMERARRIYRFTVDVSDVVPVLVGEVRTWHIH